MSHRTGIEWTDATWKIAASRVGVTLSEYRARVESGDKWCTSCKDWHTRAAFGVDSRRGDGLAVCCLASRRVHQRCFAFPPKRERGWQVQTRDGDKKQARRRVNYLVEQGRISAANDMPCIDCGDGVFSETYPHEYDHARGYDGNNQLYVEPVCTVCHRNREEARRGNAA